MDLMMRRRALIARKPARLPTEYQEVSYIIGQGSQYIDTGYTLNSGCRVQGKFNLYGDETEFRKVLAIFGARESGNYNNSYAIFNVTGNPRVDYGETLATHSFRYIIGTRYFLEFDLNAGIATVNGEVYTFSDTLKPFTCPSSALIFNVKNSNTPDGRCPKGEIEYLNITDDNGIVVRDMIPCYRKADNKPGMYDLANNQFYTNAGTGDFSLPS